ncbi:4Fe-4S dicluster domain-containing protein [Chloroflexota bacterium]
MTISLSGEKGKEICDLSFAREVKEKSQAHFERCYQCVACSSGCPVAYAMDYAPHQIIRMAQLGLKDRVLNSTTIWLCASCETCATRCPNDINIVQFMDTLRNMTLREGRTKQTNLPLFHATFLDGIKSNGKIHELMLIVRYMLASGDIFKFKKLFKDAILGLKMFLRGRLAILPDRIKGVGEVKRIFQLTKEENS